MAAKKSGLGKGLEALFAENAVEEQGKAITLRLLEIEPNGGALPVWPGWKRFRPLSGSSPTGRPRSWP